MTNYIRRIILFVIIAIAPCAYVMADQLKEGQWKGKYVNIIGDSYPIELEVKYVTTDETKMLQIEMVKVGLKPRPKHTYQLENINLKEDALSFKIKEEHDTKQCSLKIQENNEYSGECKSDHAANGETSTITMAPVIE